MDYEVKRAEKDIDVAHEIGVIVTSVGAKTVIAGPLAFKLISNCVGYIEETESTGRFSDGTFPVISVSCSMLVEPNKVTFNENGDISRVAIVF